MHLIANNQLVRILQGQCNVLETLHVSDNLFEKTVLSLKRMVQNITTALSFLDNALENDVLARVPDLEILLCISVCALRFYTLNMPQTPQSGQVPQQALQYLSSLESLSKLAHLQGSIAQS